MFVPKFVVLFLVVCCSTARSAVVSLDNSNFDNIVNNAEVAFITFQANWCRFSQMLAPIFEETSTKFKDEPRVVFGSVDCDRFPDLAKRFSINKFPTLKFFRFGNLAKREYRGSRSVEAMSAFIQISLEDSIKDFTSDADLESKIDKNRRNVIAYFIEKSGVEFENFRRVASNLREDCNFWIGEGPSFKEQTVGGNNVAYRPARTINEDQIFSGNLSDLEYFKMWIADKCVPLVREITFENAEELTEEGLPFLILFRNTDDHASVELYTQQVVGQLSDQRTAINFLIADGKKFAHPLHHLGKSEADLPILAIDSFRHMYLFPNMQELTTPGKLRQFVLDLHSGKLHREFHQGPDPTQPVASNTGGNDDKTTPPESVFRKLKPSGNRYTLMKDEL